MRAALRIMLTGAMLLAASPAPACTESAMLDLIGGLEAPGGYDTVWRGARHPPPRPVSRMTVGEVLDWQGSAILAGSASTAAGRYQIIRPTLQALVDGGVVSRSDRFDAATQDRLARHLLREAGYRDGERSAEVADAIARIWASLPRTSGPGAGHSFHEGIAGNHALIDADTLRGVLDCSVSVDDALRQAALVRTGERFGFLWDRFLEDLVTATGAALVRTAQLGIGLVLALFLVDLVWQGGLWLTGARSRRLFDGFVYRLLAVLLCIGILMDPAAPVGLVSTAARTIAGSDAGGGGLRLADHAAGRMALAFSLVEGLSRSPPWVQFLLLATGLAIIVLTAVQIGLVVFWNCRLVVSGIGGMLAVGFGGLSQTAHIPGQWLRSLVAIGMGLTAALLVLGVTSGLSWQLRAALDPFAAASPVLLVEIAATVLLRVLPAAVHQTVRI